MRLGPAGLGGGRHRPAGRLSAAPLLLVLAIGLAGSLVDGLVGATIVYGASPQRMEIAMAPHGSLRWDRGATPLLVVRPQRGDGWLAVARRLTGSGTATAAIRRLNGGSPGPKLDRSIVVPVELLRADLRLEAVRRLFPADRRVREGWEHWVLDPFADRSESLEWLAALFTGSSANAARLWREPGAGRVHMGERLLIPEAILLKLYRQEPVVGSAVPSPRPTTRPTIRPTDPPPASPAVSPTGPPSASARATPAATAVPIAVPTATPGAEGVLSFESDAQGPHAVYRLRRGEALYSSVVVRFTGQLNAAQVNTTALEIATRSGIDDVTSIPVDYPIRIPFELLMPEYLPAGHPRRVQWEDEQRDLARYVEVVHATDLSGVHVILDAGHGGRDTGAVSPDDAVWEATYAYDIMCRIKENLERHTRAVVWTTIRDASRAYTVVPQNRLTQDRDQVLLTHPPYDLNHYDNDERSVPVHLRWYLTNHIVRDRAGKGVPASRIVFLSIHADSLHPSVRGAMAYVPSRHLRPKSYSVAARAIRGYREYDSSPTVQLSSRFMARAEASSLRLAESLMTALRGNDVAVHPYRPVRDRVLRGKRSWVPAVLRYTLAQNAVLLEVCNLANSDDLKLLQDQAWRERFARSVVAGLASAYGSGS